MTTTPPSPILEPAAVASAVPPRRRRVSALAAVALALLGVIAGFVAAVAIVRPTAPSVERGANAAADAYACPMHPTIVQDHPGACPICGMTLVKVDRAPSAPVDAGARVIVGYRSPMDPTQTSPTPRKDQMGMDYLPVYQDEQETGPAVAGLAPVELDPGRQQLIGLRTAPVVRAPIGGQLRVVGRIAVDETRVRHVNVKNAGFVERIFVNYIGKQVKRGDPLFTLFSPDLLAAQEEYLLALRSRGALAGAGGGSDDTAQVLIDAARRRLALWDVPAAELRKLEASGQPIKAVTFYSPASGVVTKKDVVEGMKLEAGAMPYEIVDLSSVWVVADVYEAEIRQVTVGTPAALTLTAYPGRTFSGTVAFIAPMLDPQTRTVKVRLSFANPAGDLRPEMFGEVLLSVTAHDGLVVPADAIIDSGTVQVVFVAQGSGRFVPRLVETGQRDGTMVEITRGVSAGEQVVIRANFLIDSESRLRGSLEELTDGADAGPDRARVLPGAGAAP